MIVRPTHARSGKRKFAKNLAGRSVGRWRGEGVFFGKKFPLDDMKAFALLFKVIYCVQVVCERSTLHHVMMFQMSEFLSEFLSSIRFQQPRNGLTSHVSTLSS